MRVRFLAVLLALFAWYLPAYAQPGPGPGDGPPPDFQEMRRRMTERMKAMLQVNDQEWAQLEDRIETIRQLQRDAGEGPPRPSGPPPGTREGGPPPPPPGDAGPGPGPDGRQPSEVQERMRDLKSALDSDAKPEEIKARLEALRAARADARKKLADARTELRQLLTVRQEAVLVDMGVLD